MFRLNRKYKIELNKDGDPLYYTGIVLEESNDFIIIEDRSCDEVIINKNNILRATLVDDDQ